MTGRCAVLVGLLGLTTASGALADPTPGAKPPAEAPAPKVPSAKDLQNLPPEAKAALAAVNGNPAEPGDGVGDPTAKLPPELVAPWQIAMDFFEGVLRHDIDASIAFSRAPFSFDGHPAPTVDDIKRGWTRYLSQPSAFRPILYSLDVYPYDEMVKRYGPPPAKLSEIGFKGSLIAVANIDGRANLAILRKDPVGVWRVYGFSD